MTGNHDRELTLCPICGGARLMGNGQGRLLRDCTECDGSGLVGWTQPRTLRAGARFEDTRGVRFTLVRKADDYTAVVRRDGSAQDEIFRMRASVRVLERRT